MIAVYLLMGLLYVAVISAIPFTKSWGYFVLSTTNRSLRMVNNVVTCELGDFRLRLYHEVSKEMFYTD